jgi:hypothetical protein
MNNRYQKIEDFPTHQRPEAIGYFGLVRSGNGVVANFPWLFAHHSPHGFDWGYEGSGPSDLAFNIIEYWLRINHLSWPKGDLAWSGYKPYLLSWLLHQDFKYAFISVLPQEARTVRIPWAGVDAWMRMRIFATVPVIGEIADD